MYRVLVFGTGISSEHVENVLNDKCEIIAYLDNESLKWGFKNGIKVVNPCEILYMEYDYVVIASQYNDDIYEQLIGLGVDDDKILQFYKLLDSQYNYVKSEVDKFINSEKVYDVIATGISYCNLGLKEDILKNPCCKLAFGSQDLYYDYNIVKYLIYNYKEKMINLKNVIICLSYYSFQYDLSLSAMKNRTALYYEVIGKSHHYKHGKSLSDIYVSNKIIADKIFRKNTSGNYDFKWKENILNNYKTKDEKGLEQARRDCNKNYPDTVRENRLIFRSYLEMLIDNDIKPIIVVFPASKYYTNNFSERIEKEFHSIINEIKLEYDFQYIDYFRSDLFNDDDFHDVSHLNSKGAEKFTKMLNDMIDW